MSSARTPGATEIAQGADAPCLASYAKNSRKRTPEKQPIEAAQYHLICCQCDAFPSCSNPSESDGFELNGRSDCKLCAHIPCIKCKVGKSKGLDDIERIVSSNILGKIRAEIENADATDDDSKESYLWRCCKCGEGPIRAEDPQALIDGTEMCPRYACNHQGCKSCMTARGREVAEGVGGTLIWEDDGELCLIIFETLSINWVC